jgi:hypothetical protein
METENKYSGLMIDETRPAIVWSRFLKQLVKNPWQNRLLKEYTKEITALENLYSCTMTRQT